jgi:uncharacterized membrane protein
MTRLHTGSRESATPAIILGAGLGAFLDGIILHQVMHWHNMGSAKVPPTTLPALEQNMTWDGLFHLAAWVAVVAGVYLLLRDHRRGMALPAPARFTGLLFIGWGGFNLVEGIIDHQLLGLHHVRDMPVHIPLYDWLFLLLGGAGLIVAGWWLSRPALDPSLRSG